MCGGVSHGRGGCLCFLGGELSSFASRKGVERTARPLLPVRNDGAFKSS